MSKVWTLEQTVDTAVDVFKPYGGVRNKLYPTGLGLFDRQHTGIGPGTVGILLAKTGIGKSSIMLDACIKSTVPCAIISMEDGPDEFGSRLLSAYSGINSMKIRRGGLSKGEQGKIKDAQSKISKLGNIFISYQIGSTIDLVCQAVMDLAGKGAKVIWLDYIQEVRGVRESRREEVASAMTLFHKACVEADVGGMIVSQTKRTMMARPSRYDSKESGDLENKSRLLLIAYKENKDPDTIHLVLDKCTFGGEGAKATYRRAEDGVLRELTREEYSASIIAKAKGSSSSGIGDNW